MKRIVFTLPVWLAVMMCFYNYISWSEILVSSVIVSWFAVLFPTKCIVAEED